ncbi:uncharacterized protein LOC119742007 isoform X2 [Patiria miniata]|uniref:Uncharacterized protein n=1 Tax=Patiria miniata TaxID=46514 RepID=A0A914BET3_PATMI|nr:uncharacterized protein LOC119742007 isoform X2 [Patiria miniata]
MSGVEKPPDLPGIGEPVMHYEGYLEIKGPKDKDYARQWVVLIDNKMVVFNQRVTQREFSTSQPLDSLNIDRNCNFTPDNKEKTKLGMKCKAGQYKFKTNTPDDRDNWWIRFHAISKLELPKIHLLPGQTIALEEIIERMKKIVPHHEPPGKSPMAKSPKQKTFVKQPSGEKRETPEDINKKFHFYPEDLVQGFRDDFPIPPTWYFEVTRAEAQELLLNNPEHGSIIVRKSESHSGGFSLSMRQDPPPNNPQAMPTIKHYKFQWDNKAVSFKMSIEEEQPQMKTMYDLLAFFIEKHGGNIRPMTTRDLKTPQHPYELGLSFAVKDPENGEANKQPPQDTYLMPNRVAPTVPSKARPDRQSLPASFNMAIPNLPQGATASAASPNNRLSLATSETTSSSNPSQYVVPNHNRSMYINVGRDKLPAVNEETDQTDAYNTPTGHMFVLPRQQTSPLLPVATTEMRSEQETRRRSKMSPAIMDETDSYLAPTQHKFLPKPEPGNEPLPQATKPSSHHALAKKHLVFKPPSKTQSGSPMAPPTSYIRPEGRPRGKSFPTLAEGQSGPMDLELNKIFKKFGIDSEK